MKFHQFHQCSSIFSNSQSSNKVDLLGFRAPILSTQERGGDSSQVQHQLIDVRRVHASHRAFVAIRRDGSVVTWGHAAYGGDSSAVQEQLEYL